MVVAEAIADTFRDGQKERKGSCAIVVSEINVAPNGFISFAADVRPSSSPVVSNYYISVLLLFVLQKIKHVIAATGQLFRVERVFSNLGPFVFKGFALNAFSR